MRGLVSALNLFNQAIAYAVGLACAGLVKDPYLTWDFGAPTIIGIFLAIVFYWIYRDLDKEEYILTQNIDYEAKVLQEKLAKENHQERDLANGSSVGSEKGDIAPALPSYQHDFGNEKNITPEIKEEQ